MLGVRHPAREEDVHLVQRQLLRRLLPGPSREGQAADARSSRGAHVLRVRLSTREQGSIAQNTTTMYLLLPLPLFDLGLGQKREACLLMHKSVVLGRLLRRGRAIWRLDGCNKRMPALAGDRGFAWKHSDDSPPNANGQDVALLSCGFRPCSLRRSTRLTRRW